MQSRFLEFKTFVIMKYFATLVVAAAVVASAYSAPATKAVDFNAVAAKVAEIEASVRNSGQQVISTASNDNQEVGNAIADKVNIAAVSAGVLLQQINDAVAAQTLTVGQVHDLNGQLKGVFGKLLGSIKPELAQLTPEAAAQIRAIHKAALDTLDVQTAELAALLIPGPSRGVLVVDWNAVSAKVGDIEQAVRQSGQDVVDAANGDNEVVGSTITEKVQATAVLTAVVLQQANDAVTAQTLTVAQVHDLAGQLKGDIGRLRGSISTELAQLSPETSAQIKAIFKITFDTIDVQAVELSALLTQV